MANPPDTVARQHPMIVFSDLDGTLLDHETYSFSAARPALELLRLRAIPLVLASSKTAAEIAPLRAELGFGDCPAIVENGAGVLPAGEIVNDESPSDYNRIRDLIESAPDVLRNHFRGFADLGVNGVVTATGLSEAAARKASMRRFSEPGLWGGTDAELEAFISWLAQNGIHARYGGRFLTLSLGGTKADRMGTIAKALYPDHLPFTVALGDAPNDIEMLEQADRGFIVANPHGKPVPKLDGEQAGRISRTRQIGPAGWNEALTSLVS